MKMVFKKVLSQDIGKTPRLEMLQQNPWLCVQDKINSRQIRVSVNVNKALPVIRTTTDVEFIESRLPYERRIGPKWLGKKRQIFLHQLVFELFIILCYPP